ncbi:MAG: DUF935 family protein [Flavipsychrobacter sp.]
MKAPKLLHTTRIHKPTTRQVMALNKQGKTNERKGLDDIYNLLIKMEQRMKSMAKQDIGTWRNSHRAALNPQRPNRRPLYSIYRDAELDDQVETVMSNLIADVMSEEYYITKANNTEKDDKASDYLERSWFYYVLEEALKTEGWGHQVLQLTSFININGFYEFGEFEDIDRDHIIPEWGLFMPDISGDEGINYRDPLFAKSVLEIGKPKDLGKLLKASKPALYKKNMEAAWSQHGEIFGSPFRIGKVSSGNKEDLDRMEEFLKNMGRSAYAVTDIDDSVELVETSKGDAYMVFDQFLARADRAISKIFLGQTMTTDNGSSKSQAEVHERVGKSRMWALKLKIEFLVNDKILPMMRANGYPIKEGQRFKWAVVDEITTTDIVMDEFLVQNFELTDLEYFEKKYGVKIKGLREFTTSTTPKNEQVKEALTRIKQLHLKTDKLYQNGNCC